MNTMTERAMTEQEVKAEAAANAGKSIKCVVWDLDHTLWDGVLAEGDQLTLKPGIADILATLDSRGILLSIASKNERTDAMRRLEQFGLAHFFLYPQISWNPKSAAIGKIQKELNIGIDTFLFIDDQPFERDEVAAVHPAVACVDASLYTTLLDDPRLNPAVISDDAARRRLMYLEDITRKQVEEEFSGTPEDFLATLDMSFLITPAREADLLRAEELTVRTNQLNSTGITYDMAQLQNYMQSDSHRLLICELTDKYGSYGKIGLALVEITPDSHHIKLMLMSCRTVSRGVGSVLLTYLMKQAAADGKKLRADFRRTERNRQMLVTYQFSNFKEMSRDEAGNILFENDLSNMQEYPAYIKVLTESNQSN